MTAAPLKPQRQEAENEYRDVYPRSHDRGPIEAISSGGIASGPSFTIRGHMTAAPLK